MRFDGEPGLYQVDVEYFDQNNGVSSIGFLLETKLIDEWSADAHLPALHAEWRFLDSPANSRSGLQPGDELISKDSGRTKGMRSARLCGDSSSNEFCDQDPMVMD